MIQGPNRFAAMAAAAAASAALIGGPARTAGRRRPGAVHGHPREAWGAWPGRRLRLIAPRQPA